MSASSPSKHAGTGAGAGEVALVTGAASGIGLAIARTLLEDGCRVALADIDRDGAQRVAERLGVGPAQVLAVGVDVADTASVSAVVDEVEGALGPVGILCNNAGIMDGLLPAADTPDEIWARVLAVDLTGPFLLTRRVLATMTARRRGAIVNTASISALLGGRAGAAYTAAKHGLIGLTRSVAWHYAPMGIRCNAVCPGGIRTNIDSGRDRAPAEARERSALLLQTAVRLGDPQEVAEVVAFLASDAAALVNGAVVTADAGWSAG